MDEGVKHIQDLLDIIQTNDQGARFVNRCEIGDGGEEKLLAEVASMVREMKDNRLVPFVRIPFINRKIGPFTSKWQ